MLFKKQHLANNTLDLPPTQDSGHHQDDELHFLGSGILINRLISDWHPAWELDPPLRTLKG